MNISKKMKILYESINCKNWQEFGKFVGINGDWCLELSKKKDVSTIDITRLLKICYKFNISIDWFLSDDNEDVLFGIQQGYPDEDIGVMLDKIIIQTNENSKYYDTPLKKEGAFLVKDCIYEVKKLIQNNL